MTSDLSFRIRNMKLSEFDGLLQQVLEAEPGLASLHLSSLFARRSELHRDAGDEAAAQRDGWSALTFQTVRGAGDREEGFVLNGGPESDRLELWKPQPSGAFEHCWAQGCCGSNPPLLRAYCLHVLWETRQIWKKQMRDAIGSPLEVARSAVRAHVEVAAVLDRRGSTAAMFATEHWRAAIHVARKIQEPRLLQPALAHLRETIDRLVPEAPHWANTLVRSEVLLTRQGREDTELISDVRLEELLRTVGSARSEMVRLGLDHCEFDAVETYAEIERLLGRGPDANEAARRHAEMFVGQATRAKSTLHAGQLWKSAAIRYRDAGLVADYGKALARSRECVANARAEMTSQPIPLQFPQDDERVAYEARFFDGADATCDVLARLATRLFALSLEDPTYKFDRSQFIAHKLLATQPITGDRLGAPLAAGSPEQEKYLDQQDLIFEIQLGGMLAISPVLLRLREEWELDVDDLLSAVTVSQFVESDDVPFLRTAFERYLAADFVSSMHVLTPRLEQMVRRLFRAAGVRVTAERDGELRERTLGELLRAAQELGTVLEPKYITLLQAMLAEPWGLNLRNEVAHGLITTERCHQLNVERLIHLALVLARLAVSVE